MADRIQIRRDTDADWTSNNPTPAAGEPFLISDTKEFGVGDGTSGVSSLDTVKLDGPRGVLGYAEVTSSQTGITTETDLTGLSVTLDVPAGRRVRVSGYGLLKSSVAGDAVRVDIYADGAAAQISIDTAERAGVETELSPAVVLTPSAASHTYKLTARRQAGTGTVELNAGAAFPAFILVEDIGAA